MRVRITTSIAGPEPVGAPAPGDELDLPAEIAEDLVRAGYAELVPMPKRSTKQVVETASISTDAETR